MIGFRIIGKIWANVPIQYFEICNNLQSVWAQFPVLQLLISSGTHKLDLVHVICSETHALVFNWKWLGFKSLGKFEQMYPLNTFEIYNQKIWVNGTHSIFWNLQSVWVQFPLFHFLICIAKDCHEYHSPSVELEMITSIPIPDL